MEKNYTETYYEKERIMNERESEMKEELFSAEDQMYHLTQQLRQKEEEYKRKEEIWRRQLDALKLQMESNGKKYDFNSAVVSNQFGSFVQLLSIFADNLVLKLYTFLSD